jgi:hypothetical protein
LSEGAIVSFPVCCFLFPMGSQTWTPGSEIIFHPIQSGLIRAKYGHETINYMDSFGCNHGYAFIGVNVCFPVFLSGFKSWVFYLTCDPGQVNLISVI